MKHSGVLDQTITLHRQDTSIDRFGQRTVYPVVANVAARVSPMTGREFFAAGAMQAPATLEVEIYYRPDIDASWRITWMSRAYELVAEPIDTEAKHVSLILMCRAVPAASVPAA